MTATKTSSGTVTSTTNSAWDSVTSGSIPLNIDDATTTSSGTTNASYIYGDLLSGGTAPVEQITTTGSGSTAVFLVANQTGVQGVYGSTGSSLEQALYSVYGKQTLVSGSDVTPFGFQGSYTDSTGLIYLINRYYDSTTDEFMSIDPEVATTDQPYVFTNDDPLNSEDPLGLSWLDEGPEGWGDINLYGAAGLGDAGASSADSASEGTGSTSAPDLSGANSSTASEAVRIEISESRYPEASAHISAAQGEGQPSELTINRLGASQNRVQALRGYKTISGLDRDEYPPAVTNEGGEGSSVRYINSGDNRGAGASMGNQITGLPDGTLIHIVVVR